MEQNAPPGDASKDSPSVDTPFGITPRYPWWAGGHIRLAVLLALLGATVLALVGVRGYWFDLGGGSSQASGAAFAPGCPGRGAPEVKSVPVRELSALHSAVSRIMPPRVGRVYEMGAITTSSVWTDDRPVPFSSTQPLGESAAPAGYEVRWWALDRDGALDDVVASVLEFATEKQADDVLARAARTRCRRDGVVVAAPFPARSSDLAWVNPDNAPESDVLFVRGRRLYRIADSPPSYLPAERRGARMSVNVLACALPDAACSASAPTTHHTNLATPTAIGSGTALRLSRAQETAYAHVVNLHAYDVPGLRRFAPEGPTNGRYGWAAFASCSGEPRALHAVRAIHSPIFGYSGRARYESVYSTVTVLPSEAIADRYVATLASARALHCIAHAYDQALPGRRAKRSRPNFSQIALTRLPATAPSTYRGSGPYRGVALRRTIQIGFRTRRGRRVWVPLYIQRTMFASGRSVIELTVTTLTSPLPNANARYLMSALVGRAEAGGWERSQSHRPSALVVGGRA
jgi:hypothetical protein